MPILFAPHKNLVTASVLTAPSPATSGTTLVLASGTGASFPSPSTHNYNVVVYPSNTFPNQLNSEVVTVTAISTDTMTIVRGAESSTPRAILVGDNVSLVVTAKTLTDIEDAVNTVQASIGNLDASAITTGVLNSTHLPALGGDLSSSAGSNNLTLATVNSTVGSFGDSRHVAAVTVNAKGLVTAASSVPIAGLSGDVVSSAGSSTTTLATVNGNPGSFGDSTHIPIVTVNAKGLVTAVATSAISFPSVPLIPDITDNSTTHRVGFRQADPQYTVDVLGDINFTGTFRKNGVDYSTLPSASNTASGTNASAVGHNNTASGTNSSAFGYHNSTDSTQASAFGYHNLANSAYSTALGNGNVTSSGYTAAVGMGNTASGHYSAAFGYKNLSSGDKSAAFGYRNTASGAYSSSSAFGFSNTASGDQAASAVGANNIASGNKSSAFGYKNTASGLKSAAFGYNNAAGLQCLAIGSGNSSSGGYGSAVGYGNAATAARTAAVGYGNTASLNNAAAIGFINIASGVAASAVGYMNTASGYYTSAFGYKNVASGDHTSAFGYTNLVTADNSVAVGYTNNVGGSGSAAFGYTNNVGGSGSVAVGYNNNVSGDSALAFGNGNIVVGIFASAVGYQNITSGVGRSATFGYKNTASAGCAAFGYVNHATSQSSAFGRNNTSSALQALAVGHSNTASGVYSSAVGFSNIASMYKSSAFGYGVNTVYPGVQELGKWDTGARQGAVRIHSTGLVNFTVQKTNTAYTDGGATAGYEADGTLMRSGLAFRVNTSNQVIMQYNDNGTMKSATIATLT